MPRTTCTWRTRAIKRIQVFDDDGNFKTQYINVGAPSALCITPGPHQYLYSSNSNDRETWKMAKSTRWNWTAGSWVNSEEPESYQGVRLGACAGLSRGKRALCGRDHELARAKDPPAPREDQRQSVVSNRPPGRAGIAVNLGPFEGAKERRAAARRVNSRAGSNGTYASPAGGELSMTACQLRACGSTSSNTENTD